MSRLGGCCLPRGPMATERALLTLDTLLLPLIVDALLVRRGGAATAHLLALGAMFWCDAVF